MPRALLGHTVRLTIPQTTNNCANLLYLLNYLTSFIWPLDTTGYRCPPKFDRITLYLIFVKKKLNPTGQIYSPIGGANH
jgi:hypothetical protein